MQTLLRRVGLSLLLVAWVVSPLLAGSSTQNTWRPYENPYGLVTVGMSKGEVLIKAGKPQTTEIISLGTDGFASVSVWTYIRPGYNAGIANLTFKGNKLVRIETEIVQ